MVTLLEEGILTDGEGVNRIFLNVLEIRLVVEEEENTTIKSVEVLAHKQFSDDDLVERLLSMMFEGKLGYSFQLFVV